MRLTDIARKGTGKQEKACASWGVECRAEYICYKWSGGSEAKGMCQKA